jgi:Uma2 family endonuclease
MAIKMAAMIVPRRVAGSARRAGCVVAGMAPVLSVGKRGKSPQKDTNARLSGTLSEWSTGTNRAWPIWVARREDDSVWADFVFLALYSWVQQLGGTVLFAPLRLRIRPDKYREPDILLVCNAGDPRRQNRYWLGADLVVEIVSPNNPERDTHGKRLDYAEVGIPDYWIVNPEEETITVFQLARTSCVEHGVFHRGDTATSALLPGFQLPVNTVLDAS